MMEWAFQKDNPCHFNMGPLAGLSLIWDKSFILLFSPPYREACTLFHRINPLFFSLLFLYIGGRDGYSPFR